MTLAPGGFTGRTATGVASRHLLIQGTITNRVGRPCEGLSSVALLTALLATALLAATPLLAATALFVALALLAATALFVTITLFVAIALLPATPLLAAFLSGNCRFDGFIRIALCFHRIFLILVTEFKDSCAQKSALIMKTHNRDDG
jgi:hypothetical protein